MGSYSAARTAANASHSERQRRFGGGVSDKEVAHGVHAHERHLHKGEKETKLRNGGAAVEGRASGGRRMDRKGKGKGTTVNIILGGQQGGDPQREQMAHQAGMQQGAQMGAKMAAAKMAGAGGGGPPPGAVPPRPPIAGMGAPPPGGPPPMMPGRKRGGRAGGGESMKFGSGSGEGRLEKTKLAEKERWVE